MQIGKILRHRQNENEFHPFGRLKMSAGRHFDPAPSPKILLSEQKHRNQRGESGNIHPMNLFEQGLIVEQADQEHRAQSRDNPVDLPDVGSGELGVLGGAMNLHYARSEERRVGKKSKERST